MAGEFEGKVALVTGAGSGFGRATSLLFARDGAKVVCADINLQTAEQTAHLIEDTGGDAIAIKTDVSKAAEVEAMVKATVKKYKRLDCAFNNAGIGGLGKTTDEYTEDEFDRTIAINLKSVWLGMKYEIPQMLRQGGGCIVNTASIVGLVAMGGLSAYVASKHGVLGLTKTAALEYARKGIRVNAVCPGIFETPLNQKYWDQFPGSKEEMLKTVPLGRYGQPEEIAEAVVWLCSDAASFVHGHPMVVDGTFTAQ
ncbi:MAG: SDR family oxidoreductase [SAR202 cluster bacterium]|nr:SDR family oxidoreductase [SAR202 cluster bacterium]